jgi:hypothetical protein
MQVRLPRAISLLVVATCVGCAPNVVIPRTATFNPDEYASYDEPGKGVITGQAFLRTRGGEVRYGAGSEVSLTPVTTYSREWWDLAIVGRKRLATGDPRVQAYTRKVLANGEGRFSFGNLPPGEYYVVTSVFWEVPSGSSRSATGQIVGQQVRLEHGGYVALVLNDVYTTVATSESSEIPSKAVPVRVATQLPSVETGANASPLTGGPQQITTAPVTAADPQTETPGSGASTNQSPLGSAPLGNASNLSLSSPTPGSIMYDQQVRQAIGDLRRRGIAQSVRETATGLLRAEIPGGPGAATSAEYHLSALYNAYRRAMFPAPNEVVVELYSGGAKFGEYSGDGLLIGPEFTTAR